MKSETIRIVIVDDNKSFQNVLSSYLSNFEEFEVVGTADNGLEAIEVIKEREPDIVLLDVVMPHLDGIGVLENMKAVKMARKSKFIMLSAVGQDRILHTALSLGAEFYIIKPFDLSDLVSRIRQIQCVESSEEVILNPADDIIRTPLHKITEKPFEEKVMNLLEEIGIPPHLKGYSYVKHAIMMVEEDLTAINSLSKVIYQDIAETYRTTTIRVEKAIRNTVDIAWNKGNMNCIDSPFVTKFDQKPTNSEFITMIVDHFRIKSRNNGQLF